MKLINVIAITLVIVLSLVVFSFFSEKESASSNATSDKAPPTSKAPEGDVSYLSPEAETPQHLEEDFFGVAADPNMTMPKNMLPEDIKMYDDIV